MNYSLDFHEILTQYLTCILVVTDIRFFELNKYETFYGHINKKVRKIIEFEAEPVYLMVKKSETIPHIIILLRQSFTDIVRNKCFKFG